MGGFYRFEKDSGVLEAGVGRVAAFELVADAGAVTPSSIGLNIIRSRRMPGDVSEATTRDERREKLTMLIGLIPVRHARRRIPVGGGVWQCLV